MKNNTGVFIGICLAFIIYVYSSKSDFDEQSLELEKLQYENKQLEIERQEQSRLRVLYTDSISSLLLRVEELSVLSKEKDEGIKRVKGRYKNYKPTELENEMEKRASSNR